MPYYFVDGIRAGANAQSLYVQAENAEAAKTRAQALGLEPTGVRLAKNLDEVPLAVAAFWRHYTWMSIPIFMIYAILLMMSMFFLSLSKSSSREPPYPILNPSLILLLTIPNMMILPVVNTVAGYVAQLMQDRERMQLELKELRQRLESLNPTV